jgi:hypothetical protein
MPPTHRAPFGYHGMSMLSPTTPAFVMSSPPPYRVPVALPKSPRRFVTHGGQTIEFLETAVNVPYDDDEREDYY